MTTVAHLAIARSAVLLVAGTAGLSACGAATTPERSTTREPLAAPDRHATMAPLPKGHPQLVVPVAGDTVEQADRPASRGTATTAPHRASPKITGPATVDDRRYSTDGVRDLRADRATALPNGVALPPLDAPEAVLDVIRAGNTIARTPYIWGGGHGRFQDNGYDCSGSVSYALYYAGLLDRSHTSGELMAYGKPGPGKWITLYASPEHVYMTVAGIRFDTRAQSSNPHDSRWINSLVDNSGYEARHPTGL